MKRITNCFLVPAAAMALAAGTASATTVYQDDFTGHTDVGADGLNGETPDIGASNWVAASTYGADGSITNTAGSSATLAFTPVDGFVYTLDASFTGFTPAAPGIPENDWVALGFANGQSNTIGNNERFVSGNVKGIAWSLLRGGTTATVGNTAWLGNDSTGTPTGGNAVWTDAPLANAFAVDMDLRVVLDTTGGTGNWTATWLAKLAADGSYTEVRATEAVLSENIDAVGIARSNAGFTASITNFELNAVPEPSSLALLGLGGLLIARRRRA